MSYIIIVNGKKTKIRLPMDVIDDLNKHDIDPLEELLMLVTEQIDEIFL